MNYILTHKEGESLTYEEVINDEKIQYLLGTTNSETSPLITINLYYLLLDIDNIMCSIDSSSVDKHLESLKMHTVKYIIQKSTCKIGDTKQRVFLGYKDRIKDMFDSCISEKEVSYQKIFPHEKLGIPIIYAFTIRG